MHTFECDVCDHNMISRDAAALADEIVRHGDFHALNNQFHENVPAVDLSVAPDSGEDVSTTTQQEEGAFTMMPQNKNIAQTNEAGDQYVPFALADTRPGKPVTVYLIVNVPIQDGALMPEDGADDFPKLLVDLMREAAASPNTPEAASVLESLFRENAEEVLAEDVFDQVKAKGFWSDHVMGADGNHNFFFSPEEMVTKYSAGRDREMQLADKEYEARMQSSRNIRKLAAQMRAGGFATIGDMAAAKFGPKPSD